MVNFIMFFVNIFVGAILLVFSIVWIPLTYLLQGLNFLWRKLLGLDT